MVVIQKSNIINTIIRENIDIVDLFYKAGNLKKVKESLRKYILKNMRKEVSYYYNNYLNIDNLKWEEYASIRLLDYIDNDGLILKDQNLKGIEVVSEPITLLYNIIVHKKLVSKSFLFDMLYLFRQYNGVLKQNIPTKSRVLEWMQRYSSGLEADIIRMREKNKRRIITKIVKKIESGEINRAGYKSFLKGAPKNRIIHDEAGNEYLLGAKELANQLGVTATKIKNLNELNNKVGIVYLDKSNSHIDLLIQRDSFFHYFTGTTYASTFGNGTQVTNSQIREGVYFLELK